MEEYNPYMQMRPERAEPRLPMPELDEVAWADLEDAYGPATAVPEQIRALTSPDPEDRDWAIEALVGGINHQGSVYSGSTAAVPFLIALAANPEVEARELILALLAGLAVHVPDKCLVNGAFQYRSPAYAEVLAGGPTFMGLLADPSAAVRTGAAFVLAFLEPVPDGAFEALRTQLTEETDPLPRACILLALGYASRYAKSSDDRDLVAGYLDAADAVVRLGAAVALTQMEGNAVSQAAKKALESCYDVPSLTRETAFWPWVGELSHFARVIRNSVTTDDELLQQMDDTSLPQEKRDEVAKKCMYRMLRADRDRLHDLVLPEELNANQLRLLEWYAGFAEPRSYDYGFFERQGLPDTFYQLWRFVGVEDGGCEQRLAMGGREVPAWYAIYGVLRDQLDRGELLEAAAAMEVSDLLVLVSDALAGPWRLNIPRGGTPYGNPEAMEAFDRHTDKFVELMADLAEVAGEKAEQWATDLAEEQLGLGKKRKGFSSAIAAIVLARTAKRRDETLAARWDALLTLDLTPANTPLGGLALALELLPKDRRHQLLAERPLFSYATHTDPTGTRYRWMNKDGWRFLSLLEGSAAAQRVIDALLEHDRHKAGKGNWEEHAAGGVKSTIKERPQPDQPFLEDRAIDVLARGGSEVVPLLKESLEHPDLTSRELVEKALARVEGGE